MNLSGNHNLHFRRQRPVNNTYRILGMLVALVSVLFIVRGFYTKEIKSPFSPTEVPTRTSSSFAQEGETHFISGNLTEAIRAYKEAVRLDPQNVAMLAELARIQVYSSTLLTTDNDKRTRLEEAVASADQAVKIAPENSTAYAARAFALDWLANKNLVGDNWQDYLTNASQDAVRARQYDNANVLAMAYYAEILLDQQQLVQAQTLIQQALSSNEKTMDIYRINGTLMEMMGNYKAAIDEYKKALQITPNFTYLYIKIGVNYRQLRYYEDALDNYSKAAHINEQLGVQDPIPYLSLANTYTQTGDFFIAARNVKKALSFDPSNPSVYANLGMVYYKSRNYEGSIEALQCAVKGCNAETSCSVRQCDDTVDPAIPITGMSLSDSTVVYYYTYGSALAGMSRSYNDYCTRATEVLSEIRSKFGSDAVIMAIIQPSEEICASMANASASSPTPTGTLPTSTPNPKSPASKSSTPRPTATKTPVNSIAKTRTPTSVRPTATPTIKAIK
jgi:tetratricopeptide (TPR) repeat protein